MWYIDDTGTGGQRLTDSLEDDFNPGVEIRDIVKENMILCVD